MQAIHNGPVEGGANGRLAVAIQLYNDILARVTTIGAGGAEITTIKDETETKRRGAELWVHVGKIACGV